ncbi:hypothetical protein Tco_0116491 [Tanacetum coccineum]
MTPIEKKRKRKELMKEVFVTEDVRVDGMGRNLIPPLGVIPIQGLVISEPESKIFFMNGNTDIGFHRESEFLALQLYGYQSCKVIMTRSFDLELGYGPGEELVRSDCDYSRNLDDDVPNFEAMINAAVANALPNLTAALRTQITNDIRNGAGPSGGGGGDAIPQ